MIQSISALPTQPIDPPSGIGTVADIKRVQRALGVKDDGIWGPITQAAYERENVNSFANTLQTAVQTAEQELRQAEIDSQLTWKHNFSLSETENTETDQAYLESVLQQNAIMTAQRALGVEQTGVWDEATRVAYSVNPSALYSGQLYDLNGTRRMPGDVFVFSGNVRTPWTNETERCRINDEFVATYGFAGYDGCGGVFGKNGMSSNPYFVQDKTGLTREQLNSAGLSSVPDAVLGSDLWRKGFTQLRWNGYSVVGNGLGWPPTLIKQPQSAGLDVFLGVNNGYVNWNTLLSAQPSTTMGRPVPTESSSSLIELAPGESSTSEGGWTTLIV